MNLVVDIGNTLVKLAVFDRGEIVFQRCVERLHPSMLEELFAVWPVRRAVVASTRGEVGEVADLLRPRVEYLLEFSSQTPVPIGNAYLTPETLGRDRLAAAVGATVLYPGRNVLIVDFGTAVTIDLVTADATFRGGCISPGMKTLRRDRKRRACGAYHPAGHRAGRDERNRVRNRRLCGPHAQPNRRFMRNFYRRRREFLC